LPGMVECSHHPAGSSMSADGKGGVGWERVQITQQKHESSLSEVGATRACVHASFESGVIVDKAVAPSSLQAELESARSSLRRVGFSSTDTIFK
jgi:hypothetical protein